MEKYAIIGYPLSHSLSPKIHNSAFNALNMQAGYEKIEIEPQRFDERILRLKTEDWRGFNVTIPYKETIKAYLDEIDPVSVKIGAINTVKVENGLWKGYNTDYLGFIRPLENELKNIESVLILGAGGAARAVIYGLLEKSAVKKITVANRTKHRAAALLESVAHQRLTDYNVIGLDEAGSIKIPIDLIVNTTSVGMGALQNETPLEINKKFNKSIVYDLIYNPKKSKLLYLAEQQGCKIINGMPMLVYQAEESFKIWTGKNFPDEVFKRFL